MASQVQKAQYHVLELAVPMQGKYSTDFCRERSVNMSNYKWFRLFCESNIFVEGKRPGYRPVTEAKVNEARVSFVQSPEISTIQASGELSVPPSTRHTIL